MLSLATAPVFALRNWAALVALCGAVLLALCRAAPLCCEFPPRASAGEKVAPPPESQPADDAIQPFSPRTPRTEQQQDRVQAQALFAAARMEEHRGNLAAALARYQRAVRYDSGNTEALERVIELSHGLGQQTVAARYSSILVERDASDPLVLLRAIIYLREEGRIAAALRAYEKGIAQQHGATASPAWVEVHKLAGELYARSGQVRQAADALALVNDALLRPTAYGLDSKMIAFLQWDAESMLTTIADAMILAGREPEAKSALERAEKAAGGKFAWPHGLLPFGLARIDAQAGRHDKAIAHLEQYLQERCTREGDKPYRLLATELDKIKQSDRLMKRLEQALADDSGNDDLGYFLASQYLAVGKPDEARRLFEKLLARKPTTAGYRGLVELLRRDKQVPPLLSVLGEAVGRTGGLDVLGPQAAVISGDAGLLAALVAEANSRFRQSPKRLAAGPRLALALLLTQARQFDLAAGFFERAIEAEPEQKGATLLTWGQGLLVAQRYAEAARIFQRAVDERAVPAADPTVQFYLAGALAMNNQFDAALAAARKAAAVEEENPEYVNRAAWVLYRAKRYDEARTAYANMIRDFGPVRDVPVVREGVREARLILSHLDELKGDRPAAEELLEEVLDEFPDNIGARNDLGYQWAEEGRHLQRALAMLREAVAAEPDNFAYRDSLGWALFRVGRFEEAVTELRRAAKDKEPDGAVLDHLGDALDKFGRPAEAAAAWQQAAEAFKKENETAKQRTTQAKIHHSDHRPATKAASK